MVPEGNTQGASSIAGRSVQRVLLLFVPGFGCQMSGISPNLTFDCPSADDLANDTAFWQLYDSSFPANEREPRSVILESIRNGVGLAVRARVDACTIGFATAHLLREPPILFLVYLTVAPELRSRHIGAALFEEAWTKGTERYSELALGLAGMVWEVEIPERASGQRELQQRRRRIAFFVRLSAQVLPEPYLQPPVDGVASVPMHLMFRPAPGGSLPDNSALVRAIYFEKYHEANRIPRTVLEDQLRTIESGRRTSAR